MKKVFLISVIIFGLINLTCVNAKQEGKSMLEGKPVIEVHFATEGCTREVFINDVPVLSDAPANIPLDADYPANEWMQSGENTITLRLTPNENKKQLKDLKQLCKGEISLLVEQMDNKNIRFPIGTIKYISHPDNILAEKANIIGSEEAEKLDSHDNFKKNEDGDVTIGPVEIKKVESKYGDGVELQRTITLPLPFPKWKWLTSDKIENNEATKKELIMLYHNIWQSLHDKNFKYLQPLLKERATEMAKAMYLPPAKKNAISDFIKDTNDPDLTQGEDIATVPEKKLYLQVFGDGRLARLVAWDGGSVIYFNAKDGSYSQNYDFIFRKQDGKWIITR